MIKVGKGVVPPAKLEDVIEQLFKNEKYTYPDGSKYIYTFAKAVLTDEQQSLLTYPSVYHPIDFYIVYQIDEIDANCENVSTKVRLMSFVSKDDGFIYGYYFDVSGQSRYNVESLEDSKLLIQLSPLCTFTSSNYFEVYNNINGIITAVGISEDTGFASLQYSDEKRYFYQDFMIDGIADTMIPKTKLTGLSRNFTD